MLGLAVLFGAVGSLAMWVCVVAPLIGRSFGVPLAFGLWRLDRKNAHLTKAQFVLWFGMFCVGVGMFLYDAVFDYLSSTLLHDDLGHASNRVVGGLIVAILCGLLVGLLSTPKRQTNQG
jgi:hypothetical protein